VTNCLNYGDPTRPEAFWQLTEGVRGLGDACRALGLPVTGGNVSLYNESAAGSIAPTPEIGVVGLLEDVATRIGPAFVAAHDVVVFVGSSTPGLAGSAYAALAGVASEDGPPSLDLRREAALQRFVREAIASGLVASARSPRAACGRLGAAWERSCASRWAERRRSSCSARAPAASYSAVGRATPPGWSSWPDSTDSRSRSSGR
jgi:phosphoribosylformylglycinamidine synthase